MYTPQKMIRGNPSGSNHSTFWSPKLKRNVSASSDLELDACVTLDCNPCVIRYCEQPLTITGQYEGQSRKSTFDLWIEYEDGEELVEIKYSKHLHRTSSKYPKVLQQTTLQKNWCLENGKRYRILTEKDIRKDSHYFIPNLHRIHRALCGIRNLDPNDLDVITDQLDTSPKTLGELNALTEFTASKTFALVSWLICNGVCTVDLSTRRLDHNTEVSKGCLDLD